MLKKIEKISIFWNVVLLSLLFFQTTIIFYIAKKQLFPDFAFIKSLLDKQIIEFLKTRGILTFIFIISFIILEIVLFFVINIKMSKKIKYYKYLNIYAIFSFLFFIFLIAFYSLKIVKLANYTDLSLNNKVIKQIYDIILNMKIEKLIDIQYTLETIIVKIRSDNNIYGLVMRLFNSLNVFKMAYQIWNILNYLILILGIYLNIKKIKGGN